MKKLNKVLLVVAILFLVVGCGNMDNTPTKKVEEFLGKYQTQDKDVLDQLNVIIEEAGNLIDTQKEDYRDLMKKQYQNLSYKIKDETEDGDNATVEVEIEVYDYGKAISESETYLTTNRDEFLDEDTNEVDTKKFLDYKIEQMKNVKDKVTYTINFTLTKVDGTWQLDDISDIDRQKLHGLYY
jgi:hypothetical protein